MSATATAVDPAVQLAERVAEISSLPDTAMKIVETVQNPRSGAQDLMRVLQADPSLTARVLRTINSAAYGLSERVTDLQKAISFLGFNQIRNLALTASISGVFRDGNNVGCYNRRTLWKHMVAVAIGTRMIARRVELSNPEEGFLCGLLHDIGIILIDQYAHPQFRQVIRRLERSSATCSALTTHCLANWWRGVGGSLTRSAARFSFTIQPTSARRRTRSWSSACRRRT
jgi:HD-like signal output (HDOD) protein